MVVGVVGDVMVRGVGMTPLATSSSSLTSFCACLYSSSSVSSTDAHPFGRPRYIGAR